MNCFELMIAEHVQIKRALNVIFINKHNRQHDCPGYRDHTKTIWL